MLAVRSSRYGAWLLPLVLCCLGASVVACNDDEGTGPAGPPGAVTLQVTTNVDTVKITWTASASATSYRAEIRTNPDTLAKLLAGDATEAVFVGADGVEDGVDYTAVVFAVNAEGETASSNTPSVSVSFFPWDEFYPTSLHSNRQGKATWYNEMPNGGFEQYTGIPYANLSCKNCHRPSQAPGTTGCETCHDTAEPQLGAVVEATLTGVCGDCHGRQKAEAITHGFSDVHRDAGMDCMDCHSLEDMHGDGNSYASMLDDGAIDAKCENCHTSLASNTYHNLHSTSVDCSACHIQSVVSCYNCHFETEVEMDMKKAYGQFKNWLFLVNRNDKVHAANFQSVKYGNSTFVAMAPFYAHTIARNARGCADCHNSVALQQFVAEGKIDVVKWDDVALKLTPIQGVVPVPPNFDQGGMIFDFADLDAPGGSVWSFLQTGPDKIQLLYGEPLTPAQIDKLDQN